MQNPGETLALIGGSALVVVSAAGMTAGVVLDATGVGAVVGVPLNGVSAVGIAAGLGIAGTAGASIINHAAGDDHVEPMQPGSEAVEPHDPAGSPYVNNNPRGYAG